jgi:protein arginine kinase activator
MQCDDCNERPAEVQLTAIEDNEMKTLHLCSKCAGERGLTSSALPKVPLVDFLAQLGKDQASFAPEAAGEPCPYCGTTVQDFRKTGRVGCSECYAHFEPQLRALLRRLHGSVQHAGKLYLSESSEIGDRLGHIASMRRRLQRAIDTEDFETAADLRDRIHNLELAE